MRLNLEHFLKRYIFLVGTSARLLLCLTREPKVQLGSLMYSRTQASDITIPNSSPGLLAIHIYPSPLKLQMQSMGGGKGANNAWMHLD